MDISGTSASLQISPDEAIDALNIGLGFYDPVAGFMGRADLESIISCGRTSGGDPIGLPLLLDVKSDALLGVELEYLTLIAESQQVATIENPSFFEWQPGTEVQELFGTHSLLHPGVARFAKFSGYFVSGRIVVNMEAPLAKHLAAGSPKAIREDLKKRGWKTVVGFQTRNVPHRAHEQLIRTSLEVFDGVLVQPLVGPRKKGDFTEESIGRAYDFLLQEVFPESRVMFSFLRSRMYYGGPREAVLHAVLRRNFGCTHFIVGRDHAGVSDYYTEYAAQDYCASFGSDLGIEILKMAGPYFCSACDGIVSQRSCRHSADSNLVTKISGTQVRAALVNGDTPGNKIARDGVLIEAGKGDLFI